MKISKTALVISTLFSSSVFAGAIALPEVATFDSVSSAGIANSTNRSDASAIITSPAGLSAIDDLSLSIGIQYLDAASAHEGELYEEYVTTRGKKRTVLPSAAFAQRLTDKIVMGISLHGEGGLGMKYSNGLMGGGVYKEQSVEVANLHVGAAYQLSDQLSLGGALVVQNLSAEIDIPSLMNSDDDSTQASFMLSAMYDFNPSTYLAVNYKHGVKHKLRLNVDDLTVNKDFKWPSILTLGLSHQFDDKWGMKLQTGFEEWKEYGKVDGRKMKNVYHFGGAVNYTQGAWKYQAGARYDSKSMNDYDAKPDLPLVDQWAIGAGFEYTLNNKHKIGLAYEYRDLGTPDVSYSFTGGSDYIGKMTTHRLHFLSLSYAF
ncbi:outer membrane protein transport protein [Vibrio owensii]|uniref:OmpP1/FadL family transporter n=1 Tax=Vibrio owensii TaxID=696485 RepID=UPI003398BF9F